MVLAFLLFAALIERSPVIERLIERSGHRSPSRGANGGRRVPGAAPSCAPSVACEPFDVAMSSARASTAQGLGTSRTAAPATSGTAVRGLALPYCRGARRSP
jgi:hypothetical protein